MHLLGDSEAMERLRQTLGRIGPSDATVLVTGETGVGKELIARELHALSPRAGGPFVAVNCAAMNDELLVAELFGHGRGAFTGAVEQKPGHFERAAGGTLFLDEIGELSLRGQAALLRALQERSFDRVGGGRVDADVRVIAATNVELEAAVEARSFRLDLYYRLKGIHLEVPPLRARGADVLVLARHFLCGRPLTPRAEALLLEHTWPGNVRELENAMQAVKLLCEGEIDAPHLEPLLERRGRHSDRRPAGIDFAGSGLTLKEYLRGVQQACIAQALERSGGVIACAAAELGMSRSRLSEVVHQDPRLERLAAR